MDKKVKILNAYIIITGILFLITFTGFSLGYISAQQEGRGKINKVVAAKLFIDFENVETMNLTSAEPLYNNDYTLSNDYIEFTVNGSRNSVLGCYNLQIKVNQIDNALKNEYLKWVLVNPETEEIIENGDFSNYTNEKIDIVLSKELVPETIDKYRLYVYLYNSESANQVDMLGKTLQLTIKGSSEIKQCISFKKKIIANNPNISERTVFTSAFTTSNNGNIIYKVNTNTEENKDVYYFAGEVTNNYVKFGKNTSGTDLWWRIVRTNEDDSVRLIYAGTTATTTNASIASSTFNSTINNPMYVGYMYGTTGSLESNRLNTNNSTIKTSIDSWYNTNLNQETYKHEGFKFDTLISKNAVYCNDREIGSGTYGESSTFYFAPYTRLITNKTPQYKCTNSQDKFTVSNKTGNAKLTYPIALLTADEAVYAGALYNTNNTGYYLYQNSSSAEFGWLMSPSNTSSGSSLLFRIRYSSYNGRMDTLSGSTSLSIRPVISIKSCVNWASGVGTASDPYILSVDSLCAKRDN